MLKFRADIEGLRAVAILLVVAAHAQVSGLAGGFVGVDVFFVLSGYLITGLLVQELDRQGAVDLAGFYARRFRRLFPALAVVLLFTAVGGALLLAPGDQPEQALAIASAAAWLSNFHFAFSELDYFGTGAESSLVLHTWSLGVEEQFYLLWPALLLVAVRGLPAGDAAARRRRLWGLFALMALLGFAACVVWTARQPLLAFYLMPARAWQFALGALVFLAGSGRAPILPPALLRPAGWAGLAAILVAALWLDEQVTYPGAWALLPSLGTAAVLASGAQAGGVGRLLSIPPLQAIGRLSYGWYLWHWPVLLLGGTLLPLAEPQHRAGLALLSLLLAWATYRAVEHPLRGNARLVARPRVAVAATLALIVAGASLAVRWHNAAREFLNSPEQRRYLEVRSDAPEIYPMGCDQWYHSDQLVPCRFGTDRATRTVVVLGDSIGLQWFPALQDLFRRLDWQLLVLTKSSCPIVDEPLFYARIGREFSECERWRKAAVDRIVQLRPDRVIVGSAASYAFDERQWREGSRRILERLSAAAGQVHVLRPTPALPFDGPSCLSRRSVVYEWLRGEQRCSTPLVSGGRSGEIFQALQAAAAGLPNVQVIDLTDAVCPDGQCRAERDGLIVYRDGQHLSARYARTLADPLARALGLPPAR